MYLDPETELMGAATEFCAAPRAIPHFFPFAPLVEYRLPLAGLLLLLVT